MEGLRRTGVRQLVSLGVVLAVAVLLSPAGASAAGSLVSIVDGNGDSKAQVDSGKLRVGDGNGALTVNGSVSDVGVALKPVRVQEQFSMGENTTGQSSLSSRCPRGSGS
jgi:hypothetical protein